MGKRNKYEVMQKEEAKASLAIFFYSKVIFKLGESYDKVEDDLVVREKFEKETCDITKKMFPYLKMLSHLGYENAKDLFEVDLGVLKDYFDREGTNLKDFEKNYSKVLNRYAKCLFVFAIIEEEKIDISVIDNPICLTQLMKGNTSQFLEWADSGKIKLSPMNKEVVALMALEDFNIGELLGDQIARLNNYHDQFMKDNIYSHVLDSEVNDNEVIKHAKRIGQLGPFN